MDSVEQGVLTPGRICGGCTACCTTHDVSSIKKARGKRCTHANSGGCSIYGARPGECAGYECYWLSGSGEETHWPHQAGFVVDLVEEKTVLGTLFVLSEAKVGALEAPLALDFTKEKLALSGVAVAHLFLSGRCVIYLENLDGVDERIKKEIIEKEKIEFLPNIKGEVL